MVSKEVENWFEEVAERGKQQGKMFRHLYSTRRQLKACQIAELFFLFCQGRRAKPFCDNFWKKPAFN